MNRADSFLMLHSKEQPEQETVQQSIQDLQSGGSSNTLIWPTIGGTAINEFTTTFPHWSSWLPWTTLGQRFNKVTIGNSPTYSSMMTVGQPRFRFFAPRWGGVLFKYTFSYIQQHPGDELRDIAFSNRVLHYASLAPDNFGAVVSLTPLDYPPSSFFLHTLIYNACSSDWFFCHRIQKFVEVFYLGVLNALNATDYWQHRGSPHVHGLAWLPNAPAAT